MKEKITVAGVVVALALGVVGLFTGDVSNVSPVVERTVEKVGAMASPDVYFHSFFHDGLTDGGTYFSTTTVVTQTTHTLTAANLKNKVISILNNAEFTVSIGATSTNALVPNIGDTAVVYLRNASTTAAATITLAAVDTSVDLQKTQAAGDLVIAGLDWAKLTFIRNSKTLGAASQVTVFVEENTEAD